MNRVSPNRRKGGGNPVLHPDVPGDGGQRRQVLVDRAQTRAHRVDRHVGGAGSGPLGEFVGGLPYITAPGDAAFHSDRRRILARCDRRPRHDVARFVQFRPRRHHREPSVGQSARAL